MITRNSTSWGHMIQTLSRLGTEACPQERLQGGYLFAASPLLFYRWESVASGIYFYSIQAGSYTATRRWQLGVKPDILCANCITYSWVGTQFPPQFITVLAICYYQPKIPSHSCPKPKTQLHISGHRPQWWCSCLPEVFHHSESCRESRETDEHGIVWVGIIRFIRFRSLR